MSIVITGYLGIFLNKKNLIFFLAYLEVVYSGILLNFLFIGYCSSDLTSNVYFLVVMSLAAAESVVGLVLTVLYHKTGTKINLDNLSTLHG